MNIRSNTQKLGYCLLIFCACELLFGTFVLYILATVKYGFGQPPPPDDWNPPQIFVEWWAIYRPFVFAGIWLVAFIALKQRSIYGTLATASVWLIGVYCYIKSWPDLYYFFYYLANPEYRIFLFNVFRGFNPWDIMRGALLLVMIVWWSLGLIQRRSIPQVPIREA